MTGLDPARHVIVEIATLLTDDDLNLVATGPDLVIRADDDALAAMDEVVVEMHTRSGLLEQIRASTVTLEDATAQTLEFLRAHIPEAGVVPLCGNSIGMDRRFLAVHMPEIEHYLHYRSIDVSTLKELARRWYPDVLAGAPRKETGHRALEDITESINELRYYRSTLFDRRAGDHESDDGSDRSDSSDGSDRADGSDASDRSDGSDASERADRSDGSPTEPARSS